MSSQNNQHTSLPLIPQEFPRRDSNDNNLPFLKTLLLASLAIVLCAVVALVFTYLIIPFLPNLYLITDRSTTTPSPSTTTLRPTTQAIFSTTPNPSTTTPLPSTKIVFPTSESTTTLRPTTQAIFSTTPNPSTTTPSPATKSAIVLTDGGNKRKADSPRKLSAESGGQRTLKSVHSTFLRAYDDEWKVEMVPEAGDWEQWYIEDHGGKVALKAIHSPGRFLSGRPDGSVILTDRLLAWEFWTLFKNDDGSWSFKSAHGRWLSAREDGSVASVVDRGSGEHFWLGRW